MIAEQKMPSSLLDSLADQSILYIETEWTLRLKALQQIQDFLLKEDTTLPIFLDTYKNITVNLQVQLKDLRSAIVKEAIKIITIASAKFRTLFDNIVSKFIDIFFTLVTSTTNAISKSAYEGLKSIIEHIYSPKVLLKILENSKQKSLQVKAISSECLLFTLQAFPKSIIDFVEIEQIIVAIKNFVCESGRIREIGKECFIAFTDKYPEKCDEVIQSIPPNSRKLIEELKALKKTFAIDNTAEFPMNIEISDEEWRIFEKLDVFEAVRLAVTNLSFQSSNEIQLEILMEKVDHSTWSTREKAFMKILEILNGSSKPNDLEIIVKKIVEHIKDSHVKVISACMECLVIIAEHHSILLTSYFPELLEVVLEVSLNKKEDLSGNANLILEKLLESYPSDDLLLLFLSISTNKPGVKSALIEIIQYLLEVSESFCFSHYNMSLLCKKFSSIATEGSKSTIVSVVKALEKACDKNVFGTLQGILDLPYTEQSSFKKYCQDYSPLLNEMLKGYSKNIIPSTIDVIEEVEEEDLTGSILETSGQFEDYSSKSPEEILSNLHYYLFKCELSYESLHEVVILLSQQLNLEHNEESKKALRNLAMIAKYYRSEKLGVELLVVLSKAMCYDNASLIHDLESVIKGVLEKMNTGSAVMGILDSVKKLDTSALQKMLEYLMDVIKERTNISFFGKEIGVRLKEFFTHPHPEVRKNIVLVLAELLARVEPAPFLAIFNQSQQKLIEIYRQKLASLEES